VSPAHLIGEQVAGLRLAPPVSTRVPPPLQQQSLPRAITEPNPRPANQLPRRFVKTEIDAGYEGVSLVGGGRYVKVPDMYGAGEVGWENGGVDIIGWNVPSRPRSRLSQRAITPTGFVTREHSVLPSRPASRLGFSPGGGGPPPATYRPGSAMGVVGSGAPWRGATEAVGRGLSRPPSQQSGNIGENPGMPSSSGSGNVNNYSHAAMRGPARHLYTFSTDTYIHPRAYP